MDMLIWNARDCPGIIGKKATSVCQVFSWAHVRHIEYFFIFDSKPSNKLEVSFVALISS
jgi:hypothetical protein